MLMYIKELQKLGLTEKESGVYLASLELGPDTAQNIAKKAGIGRPITYVQIELLKKKGLMSQLEKNGKAVFVAESPEKLSLLSSKIEEELKTRKATLTELVPSLLSLVSHSQDSPMVRLLESSEALSVLRQELLKSKNAEILEIRSSGRPLVTSEDDIAQYGFKVKVLYVGSVRGSNNVSQISSHITSKKLDLNESEFTVDITIFDHNVVIYPLVQLPLAIVISNESVVQSLRGLFLNFQES